MTSDYEQILRDNLKGYGDFTHHLEFLGQLYAERTHFIYELLQNAEDAKATFVRFLVRADRLHVEHDGRPFDEKDVRGLCGVAAGTKRDDLTQIGKFGIGFKSVYAYTSSPRIYSGDEHFRIESFVRPFSVDPIPELPTGVTLLVLPFNRSDVGAREARAEIAAGLSRVGPRALLFLRHIQSIAWSIDDRLTATYTREVIPEPPWRIVTLHTQANVTKHESWLTLERPVVANDGTTLAVEVAFTLVGPIEERRVAPAESTELVAFFPTDKVTGLKFLLQGPYRTTPARDNIPLSDEWNRTLIKETSTLVVEALRRMREERVLQASVLECMPLRPEEFLEDSMFRPIFDRVRQALISEALLPAHGGGYISARQGLLAQAQGLVDLFDAKRLQNLRPGNDPRWLDAGVSRSAELATYVTRELRVQPVVASTLIDWLGDPFLASESDEWLIRLYGFLSKHSVLWEHDWSSHGKRIRGLAVLRLADGSNTKPFGKDGVALAYLPPSGETNFPVVARSIAASKEARPFLQSLGLTTPDVVDEVLRYVLPRYSILQPDELTDGLMTRHLRRVRAALDSTSPKRDQCADKLRRSHWLRATNARGDRIEFRAPSAVYVRSAELETFFGGWPEAWFLDAAYDPWLETLARLGVAGQPRTHLRQPDYTGHVVMSTGHGWHERGLNAFDPDFTIDGLEHAVAEPSRQRSAWIWNVLLPQWIGQLKGTVETSTNQNFIAPKSEEKWSRVGETLRKHKWLPSGDEPLFKVPSDLALADLPDGFHRDNALAGALEMKAGVIDELAREAGIDRDLLVRLANNPGEQRRLLDLLRRGDARQAERGTTEASEAGRNSETGSDSVEEESPESEQTGRQGRTRDQVGELRGSAGDAEAAEGAADQSRLPVYVDGGVEPDPATRDPEQTQQNLRRDRTAVEIVLKLERAEGREPTEMSHTNRGYDVESDEPDGSTRFIEIKATGGAWGTRGVALTRAQFEAAHQKRDRYWIYVVEHVDRSDIVAIHKIRNPATRANRFAFDSGWKALAEE